MTKVTTPLRDQCLNHCATLGIPLAPAALDELLSRAEKEGLAHLQFLDLLLGAEAHARRERGVARRIREAHFAEEEVLEGFDWQFNPEAFDRVQIEELATGDFIRRRANLILRLERDREEPHRPGGRAEGLRAWLPRSLPHLRGIAVRPDRIARRQNSARTPAPLREPGSVDYR
jgi:hypothetical protein